MTQTATAPVAKSPAGFAPDPVMSSAIIDAVQSTVSMFGAKAPCVGLSTIPARDPGTVTGIIGVHGNVSGFVTVNLAECVAINIVGDMLQDKFDRLTTQVIDGIGELTNIIAGGVKKGLVGTPWGFGNVTVPSVIVGQNYQIAYCRGLRYLCATFEHVNDNAVMLQDRLLQVAVSLMRV